MQRQKQFGTDPFGMPDGEGLQIKPLSVTVPDVHDSMRLAGAKDLVLDPATKRSRLLCCCGQSGCGIGPMTQVEEVA